ncbi:MAG TPA: alkaline phosphatase family protein [Parvularculaceae bacterium]|nr:alkaline phosphatase family protein [Parvularculaceae bacterium]
MGTKALFIGFDGQNASLIDQQIREGTCPRLAGLAQRLARAPVGNNPGVGDGSWWASVATGDDPSEHGHTFIIQFDPKTYKHYWHDEAKHCDSRSFWEELDAEGRRALVVDWTHGTFRPLQGGIVIDNWLQHDPPHEARSYPEHVIRDVIARYGDDMLRPGLHAISLDTPESVREVVEAIRTKIAAKARFCVDQIKSGDWDIVAPSFTEMHDIGHYAMHLHDAAHPKYDKALAEAVGDPLRQVGVAVDRAIGDLIDAAGPDCEVMMLVGLGLFPLVTLNPALNEICERLDLGMGAREKPVAKARAAYRARVPLSIRAALSPLKRFILGEPENPELARRRFFPVEHVDNGAAIRINLKGRERNGVIAPGEDYRRLVDEIARDFMEIRDDETGEPVVEEIVRTQEVYRGSKTAALPDLFVMWRREHPYARIASPKIGVVEVPDRIARTGDHVMTGELWAEPQRLAGARENGAMMPQDVTGYILAAARSKTAAGRAIPIPG